MVFGVTQVFCQRCFFGWDLVFSLLDVCVTCALFLYFSCLKKKEKKTF